MSGSTHDRKSWESLSDRFEPPTRYRIPPAYQPLLQVSSLLWLAHVGQQAAKFVEEVLHSCGVDSREFAVLAVVAEIPAGLAQQTVAFRLGRDRTTVRKTVLSLERKGLVARATDLTDRRATAVAVTEYGIEIYQGAVANLQAAELEAFQYLSNDTLRVFLRAMEFLSLPGRIRRMG